MPVGCASAEQRLNKPGNSNSKPSLLGDLYAINDKVTRSIVAD